MSKIAQLVSFLETRYGPFARWYDSPFQVLIGCVLSQRTREENTARACQALFSVACTPRGVLSLSIPRLQRLIRPVGFWRQKAKRIRQICQILLKKHGGKVPRIRAELLKLPGVGFKTADVVLMLGHDIPAIAVDTHVNRISKRLGLVGWEAGVEEVKRALESVIPRDKWRVINRGLVLFGRDVCRPVRPRCHACPLAAICDFSQRVHRSSNF